MLKKREKEKRGGFGVFLLLLLMLLKHSHNKSITSVICQIATVFAKRILNLRNSWRQWEMLNFQYKIAIDYHEHDLFVMAVQYSHQIPYWIGGCGEIPL